MAMCSHNTHVAAGRKVAVLDGAYPTRFRIAQLLSPYHLTVEECGSLKEFFTPSPLQKNDTGIFVDDAALFIIEPKRVELGFEIFDVLMQDAEFGRELR